MSPIAESEAVAVDPAGNIFLAGEFDAFESDGAPRWSHALGGPGWDDSASVVGFGDGGAYLVGALSGTGDLGSGKRLRRQAPHDWAG